MERDCRVRIRVCLGLSCVSVFVMAEHVVDLCRYCNRRTIAFYLPMSVLQHETQLWPFCKVFEVEIDVVGLSQMI